MENIYFALGLKDVGSPRTVPLHSVFARCQTVVDGFEETHKKFCDFLGVQRNQELHTGHLPFENLKLQEWLASYYEVSEILCHHLDRDLESLLGPEEAGAAKELIRSSSEESGKAVLDSISAHKRVFDSKPDDEKMKLRTDSYMQSVAAKYSTVLAELMTCPACDSTGVVTGRQIRSSRPYFDDERLLQEITCFSETFACGACGLNISSASSLRWSGIEPNFIITEETSLHELQEFEYYEEYMNE